MSYYLKKRTLKKKDFQAVEAALLTATRLKLLFNLQQAGRGAPHFPNPFPTHNATRQCNRCTVHRRVDSPHQELVGFSASGFQQLDLCSALKEPLSVFCVSANRPAGRAAGLQQPAAAAVNIKYSQSASINLLSLRLVFNRYIYICTRAWTKKRRGSSKLMPETL